MARRLAIPAAALALLVVVVLAVEYASSGQKTADAPGAKKEGALKRPEGTWRRTVGDDKLVFHIRKHVLHFKLVAGDKTVSSAADYSVTKDGILFGRISKIEAGGDNGPKPGILFSFRYAVKDGTLTISDYQGPGGDEARQIIEGDYTGGPNKKR